jgi:GNAT superfamily N-acetyltransferase
MDIDLRLATAADCPAVIDVYLASRTINFPYAPLVHSEAEVREWIVQTLIPSGTITVAVHDGRIIGMIGEEIEEGCGWIRHFFVVPGHEGQGIGSRLLAHAKSFLGPPIRLYTFQQNTGARRFYERHGFQAIAFSDGSDNEENCPDILYEWS